MDWEGKVASVTARCAATGVDLVPGTACVSALVQVEGGRFERRDFTASAWTDQDPAVFVSWWRRTIPAAAPGKLRLDADLLRKLLLDLRDHDDPRRRALAYVCALALVRLRVLRWVQAVGDADGTWIVLAERGAQGAQLRLRDPRLDPVEEAALHADLLAALGG
jgi:hypothetical protein